MVYLWWKEYAEWRLKDFVNSLKHAADKKKSEAMYLAENSFIWYLSGTSTDFSTVGVKAVDDYRYNTL